MTLTFGSLFAGIGGLDLGLERAGMVCRWQVEKDAYCLKVLAKHWPDVARFEDVLDVGATNLEPVDLICGGFPCQDVSLAGKRAGLEGKRSTLWTEFARIVGEARPRWVLAENVPGLLSSDAGRFFGNILRDLAALGYDAEWDCIPAAAGGAPHRRDRIFIVAYAQGINWDGDGPLNSSQVFGPRFWSQQPRGRNNKASTWHGNPPERTICESSLCRVADGVPARVDRLRCLGNAVVPQVAELVGRMIVAADGVQMVMV